MALNSVACWAQTYNLSQLDSERKQSNLKTTLETLWWLLSSVVKIVNDGLIFSKPVEIHFLSSFPTFELWNSDTVVPLQSHLKCVNVNALKNKIPKQATFIEKKDTFKALWNISTVWILSDKTSDVMYKVEIRYLDTSWLSDLAAQQHTNLFVYTTFLKNLLLSC